MIARRPGDDAPRPHIRIERGQGVVGATELEGADVLEVLGLQENLRAATLVEPGIVQERGVDRVAPDAAGGGFDIGNADGGETNS